MPIYEHNTTEGYNYKIYIPENYNHDLPIISYNLSTGGRDNNNNYIWRRVIDAVETQGYENVVIFPNRMAIDTWQKKYQDMALTIVDDAKKKYGLTSDKIITTGFSSSCSNSVKTTAEYIQRNPGVSRQIAFATDGFIWQHGILNEDEIAALIKNDTLVVDYCQEVNKTKLSDAVVNNLDMLIITDKNERINHSASYWGRHAEIALSFFEGELYHEVLDFLEGKGTLETSKYNFYTNSGGKIKQITDPNEFYSLLSIDTYEMRVSKLASLTDYKLTSSNSVLSHYLNNIRNCIKSSAFLNANVGSYSGSSTTKTPSAITEEVSNYFSNNSKILSKIADLTVEIAKIHDTYMQADQNLVNILNNQNKE